MAETEMVEKVAKACRDAVSLDRGRSVPFEEMSYIVAYAAIEALREPTEAMKAAWQGPEPWDQDALEVWQAMIDAALSPPTKD